MRANISWAFAGNSVYAGCQWMVFVLLVRSLDLGRAGQFAYWIAVTGPIFVLANVRLRNLVVTADEPTFDFFDYLNARLLTTSVASRLGNPAGPGTVSGYSLVCVTRMTPAVPAAKG